MNFLVTGGAGFIGSHLVEKLITDGHKVSVIDNLSVSDKNVVLLDKLRCKLFRLNIEDDISACFNNIDCVIHLAAMNRSQKSVEDPLKSNRINITGTLNVLEEAKKEGVKKFVNISSSSVYGTISKKPLKETDTTKPLHPYGVGKLTGEHYTRVYNELFGIDTVSLRYFSVYGPRQLGEIEYAGVIAKFVLKILNNQKIEIYGSGDQKRNFTFVKDVVDLTIKAAMSEEVNGKIINLATSNEISVNELVKLIENCLNKKAKVKYVDPIAADPPSNPADTSLANRLLGPHKMISIEEGIMQTVEWYKNV